MASRRIGMFGVEPSEFVDDRKEDGVAALLRRRREELGRDIATVARQLRIRAIYIQAIEEGRLQDLPGTAYAVGFVRAYADYLGLDGNSIVSDYRDELARRSRQNELIWPVDQAEHRHFPGSIVLVISLVLAVAISGGWYFASQPGGTGIDLIDQVPDFMKKHTGEPVADESAVQEPVSDEPGQPAADASTAESTSPAPTTPGSTPSSAQAASEPAASESVEVPRADTAPTDSQTAAPSNSETSSIPTVPGTGPASPAAELGTTVPAAPEAVDSSNPATSSPAPVEIPVAETPVADATQTAVADPALSEKRIVLRATKDSWVEIFDAQQKVVLQRILRAGESYAVPEQEGLVMNTGNAGGLVIEVDGRAQPSLGSIGVVKRGISLAPDALTDQ